MALVPMITSSLGFGVRISPLEGGFDGKIVCLVVSFRVPKNRVVVSPLRRAIEKMSLVVIDDYSPYDAKDTYRILKRIRLGLACSPALLSVTLFLRKYICQSV